MWCGCRSRSSNRDRGRTVGSAQCTVDGTAGSKLREKDTRVCVARSRGVDGDDLRRTHSDDLITDYPACGYTAVVPLTHDDRHRRHYRRMPAHRLDQVGACCLRYFGEQPRLSLINGEDVNNPEHPTQDILLNLRHERTGVKHDSRTLRSGAGAEPLRPVHEGRAADRVNEVIT